MNKIKNISNWTKEYILTNIILAVRIEGNINAETDVYRKYIEDIVIVPVIIVSSGEDRGFVRFTKEFLGKFGISETEIFMAALKNVRNDTIKIFNVDDYLNEAGMLKEDAEIPSLLCVTNEKGMFGAHFIADESTLMTLHRKFGNLYILPSSIDEILVIPEECLNCDPACLVDMVRSVNKEAVDEDKLLSNQAFYFDGEKLQVVKDTGRCKDCEKIIDAVGESSDFYINFLDIITTDNEVCAELSQYTPAGEDWHITIWFDGTYKDFVNAVTELAADFDVDEEAESLIKYRGRNGVPNSVRCILEDQEWKKKQLELLAAEL